MYKNSLRTVDELREDHLAIWFLSNLLLSDSRHEETLKKFSEINAELRFEPT